MTGTRLSQDGYLAAFRQAFAGVEHRAFRLEAGQQAALLLHGLVGTPAEMRPLAERLYETSWTVDGPLLPGHGSDIDRLFEVDAGAWIATAGEALTRLQKRHDPILVVGHSVGAALTLCVTAERNRRLCGLVLISPFIRLPLDNPWLQLFGPLLRLVIRRMRPFKDIDFDTGANREEIRAGIREFMPGLDIDDPEVRSQIRQMEIPTRFLAEVEQVGKRARRNAPRVTVPTLVLQGTGDEVVRPAYTRRLLTQIGGRVSYHEFDAAHNLVRIQGPAWDQVAAAVAAFSDSGYSPEVATIMPGHKPGQAQTGG